MFCSRWSSSLACVFYVCIALEHGPNDISRIAFGGLNDDGAWSLHFAI
jgi:hypothetical protein